jgi:hypothetical protein
MTHPTVDVSVALDDVIVKLVPAVRAETRSHPGVPPSTCDVSMMMLLAVTFVSATVAVPEPLRVAVPCLMPVMVEPETERLESVVNPVLRVMVKAFPRLAPVSL